MKSFMFKQQSTIFKQWRCT